MMYQFVICTDNTGYEASLEPRKLYKLLPDPEAERHNQLRIIDESGEDYLFSRHMFMVATLQGAATRR